MLLLLATISIIGCQRNSPTMTRTPLSFYVVSEQKVQGGRFIDAPDFPKLGYIATTPDLVISRLEQVMPDVSREQGTMVDKDGKETVLPLRSRPAVIIRMSPEDAKKFTALTEKAIGKQVLMMLGETPLIAARVHSPIPTQSLIITLDEKGENKRIENELKKLVQ